VIIKK